MKKKTIIGRKDKGDFPELGLEDLAIKIDTGAYTSAIHCHKAEVKEVDGKEVLTFTLLDPSHEQYDNKEYSTEHFTEKQVKNSFGSSEKRYAIKTKIFLFDKLYPIELSLSERGEMRFPILIGRKFLMGKFIVDSSKYNLSSKLKTIKNNLQ
ncbi:ATP-dependent zinc protease family protein [Neolewinella aurantiaca]|uniref:ATP-dependent zinc protease family protein n=1 Tax=Neolewinella aurantiaca TaxID=2602767 RepID=UPI001FE4DFD7|nr:RimK/LysX family protein [Neolewinella aurantiaca]